MPISHRILQISTKRFLWAVLLWWRFTMFCTREKHVGMRIYDDPEEITEALGFGKRWAPDPLKGRLDIMRHPTWVQKKIDASPDGKLADCDEHAIYLCATLALLMKEVYLGCYQAADPKGKKWGHAVCIYRPYGDDAYYVIDYTNPVRIVHVRDFALISKDMLGKSTSFPIAAWAVRIKGLARDATPRFGDRHIWTDYKR